MAKSTWAASPHPDKAFDYAGDKLAKVLGAPAAMARPACISTIL